MAWAPTDHRAAPYQSGHIPFFSLLLTGQDCQPREETRGGGEAGRGGDQGGENRAEIHHCGWRVPPCHQGEGLRPGEEDTVLLGQTPGEAGEEGAGEGGQQSWAQREGRPAFCWCPEGCVQRKKDVFLSRQLSLD